MLKHDTVLYHSQHHARTFRAGEEHPGEEWFASHVEAGLRPCTDGNGKLWYERAAHAPAPPPAEEPETVAEAAIEPGPASAEPDPLDHDNNGAKGGSFPGAESAVIDDEVVIPADWRDLPWLPKEAGGPTIRSLAKAITGEGPANRDEAVQAVEAELARRAG